MPERDPKASRAQRDAIPPTTSPRKKTKRVESPLYERLESKVSLRNNPDLIEMVGSRTDAQVLSQLVFLQSAHHRESPWFFHTMTQLMSELKLSESTIFRSIKRLEAFGVRKKRKRLNPKSSESVNFYMVNMDVLSRRIDEFYAGRSAPVRVSAAVAELDRVFGPVPAADQSVMMTDSYIEVTPHVSELLPERPRPGALSESTKSQSATRKDKRKSKRPGPDYEAWDRYLQAVRHGYPLIDPIHGLTRHGYDTDFNPREDRCPEPGEIAMIVRAKFPEVPEHVKRWLEHVAPKRPVMDLRLAVDQASTGYPDDIITYGDAIAHRRDLAKFAKQQQERTGRPQEDTVNT